MFGNSGNIYHATWPNIARDGQQKNIDRVSAGRIDAGRTDLKPFIDGQRAFFMAVIIFNYFPPYDFWPLSHCETNSLCNFLVTVPTAISS